MGHYNYKRPHHRGISLRALLLSIIPLPAIANTADVTILRNLAASYPDWKPRGIVDVGANVGHWTTSVQKIFDDSKIPTFMVEASPQHETTLARIKLKYPHIDYKISVLSGEDDGTVEFYGIGGVGDSMFQERTEHFANVKPNIRTTSKIDTLVRHMKHIDYLKIDVQGAELLVLQGAEETLERATFVQLEISVVDYNKGGVCWYELDKFLRSHGFYFYDAEGFHRSAGLFRTKGIGQFDALYIKQTSSYLPSMLRNSNAMFCGAGAALTEDDAVSVNNQTLLAKYLTTNDDDHKSKNAWNLANFMQMCLVFVLGFISGHLRSRLMKAKELEDYIPIKGAESEWVLDIGRNDGACLPAGGEQRALS